MELRGLSAASLEPGLQQLPGRPPHPHPPRPRRASDGQLLVRRAEQPRRLQVMQRRQTDMFNLFNLATRGDEAYICFQ